MNALIIFSYANVHSLDDIKPFYKHIYRGNLDESSLAKGRTMYESIGTCDPLGSTTRRIGKSLVRRLENLTDDQWEFYVANKHIKPFVKDAVDQCIDDGAKRIITLALTPFYSRTGTEAYEREVREQLASLGHENITLKHIPPFYDDQGIRGVFADRLKSAVHWIPKNLQQETEIIFTSHSMPGRPEAHETFIKQFNSLATHLAKQTHIKKYHLAYRSQGDYPQIWLEPNVLDVMKQLAKSGAKAVVIAELLSVIANAEAITELGVQGKSLADELALTFVQTEYLNDSDDFMYHLTNYIFNQLNEVVQD